MRKGYTVTLGVLTILILITITIGTSYSFYSISKEQTDPNEVTTACFKIDFAQSDTINLNNQINETGEYTYAYPMSEATAMSKYTPYKMTISNTCTGDNQPSINYVVTLNTLTNNVPTMSDTFLNYKINEVTSLTDSTIVNAGTATQLSTKTYTLPSDVKTTYSVETSYNLASGNLAAGTSKSYNLYLWIDEAATLDDVTTINATTTIREGKTFSGKILVYNYMDTSSS